MAEKKCVDCGKITEDYYYGFMLKGEEFEFEDGIRCFNCTQKIKRGMINKNAKM